MHERAFHIVFSQYDSNLAKKTFLCANERTDANHKLIQDSSETN